MSGLWHHSTLGLSFTIDLYAFGNKEKAQTANKMSYHRVLPRPDTWDSEPSLIDHAQATSDPVRYQPSNGAVFKASTEEVQVDFRSEGAFPFTFNDPMWTCRLTFNRLESVWSNAS